MRIGTSFFGEIEAIRGQCIRTKFFVLGLPLVPLGSFYFTSGSGSGGRGFEIPLHGKSVLAGYLRIGLGIAALLLAIRLWAISRWERDVSDWVTFGVVLAVAIGSLFLGRLSHMERARRAVLLGATGLAADPRILPREMSLSMLQDMEMKLAMNEVPLDPAAWQLGPSNEGPYRASAMAMEADTLRLLYAYASYAARVDPAWKTAREALWQRVLAAA